MNINATGEMHVCVHEDKGYGNILQDDLKETYKSKMDFWHDKQKMIFDGCKGCDYISVCYSGCQMVAIAFNGKYGTKDPLYVGPNSVTKKFASSSESFDQIIDFINKKEFMVEVNPNLRFRKEKDFYLVNVRWANTMSLPNKITEFLIASKNNKLTKQELQFEEMVTAYLILKEILLPINASYLTDKIKADGLSLNIESLPQFKNLNIS